jgi:hypothetical protein
MKNTRVRMSPVSYPNLGPGVIPANASIGPRCHTQTPQVIGPRCHTHLLNLNLIGGRYPHGPGTSSFPLPIDTGSAVSAPCSGLTSHCNPVVRPQVSGASGYRNRLRTWPKSVVIKAIPDCHAGTSASRQCHPTIGVVTDRLSAPLRTFGPLARPRPPSKPEFLRNTWVCQAKDRGGVPWGRKAGRLRIIDEPNPYTRAALRLSERTSIGIPITHRTTRQDSAAARQRVDRHVRCVAGHGRADSPAAISESWRGMLP